MSRHQFTEPVSGWPCTLVNDPARGWWDGGVGVAHTDYCDRLADVMPDLDAFYCPGCSFNGRISGAWVLDVRRSDEEAAATS